MLGRLQVLGGQHRVAVVERGFRIEIKASGLLRQNLERSFELDKRSEVERVQGDGHHAVEYPGGTSFVVGELDSEPQLGEEVEGCMRVLDLHLGFLSNLDAANELGRPLRLQPAT